MTMASPSASDNQIINKMVHALFIQSSNLVDNELLPDHSAPSPELNNFYSNFSNANVPLSQFMLQPEITAPNKQLQDLLAEQSSQEDYLTIIRNRFNSCSSLDVFRASLSNSSTNNSTWNLDEPLTSVDASLVPHSNFQSQRRHNSFNIPNQQTFDHLRINSQAGFGSSIFDNPYKQDFASAGNNFSIGSDNNNPPPAITCLDNNCSFSFNENQKLNSEQKYVKFQCSSCEANASMHRSCFDKKVKLNRRRNVGINMLKIN